MNTFRNVLAAIAIAILATGCLSTVKESTPARIVYNAHVIYSGALAAAVAYESLPRCKVDEDAKVEACSDADVVKALRKADSISKPLLDQAQQLVRGGIDDDTMRAAAQAAIAAVTAFQKIITEQVLGNG